MGIPQGSAPLYSHLWVFAAFNEIDQDVRVVEFLFVLFYSRSLIVLFLVSAVRNALYFPRLSQKFSKLGHGHLGSGVLKLIQVLDYGFSYNFAPFDFRMPFYSAVEFRRYTHNYVRTCLNFSPLQLPGHWMRTLSLTKGFHHSLLRYHPTVFLIPSSKLYLGRHLRSRVIFQGSSSSMNSIKSSFLPILITSRLVLFSPVFNCEKFWL